MRFHICMFALCCLASLVLCLSSVDAGTRRLFEGRADRRKPSAGPSVPDKQSETTDQKPQTVFDTQLNSADLQESQPTPPNQPVLPQDPSSQSKQQPAHPSSAKQTVQNVEPDVRLQFPSLQPMMFAEARTYQVLDDSADFTPYKSGDFHPVLSAHADKDPNVDLNSILNPLRETNEDPLLEETEEDDDNSAAQSSNQVEIEDVSIVDDSRKTSQDLTTSEDSHDGESVKASQQQDAAADPFQSGGVSDENIQQNLPQVDSVETETASIVSHETRSTLPSIEFPQRRDLSIPEPPTTPMDESTTETPISPLEPAVTLGTPTEGVVDMSETSIIKNSSDSMSPVENQTESTQFEEQGSSSGHQGLQTEFTQFAEQESSTGQQELQAEPTLFEEQGSSTGQQELQTEPTQFEEQGSSTGQQGLQTESTQFEEQESSTGQQELHSEPAATNDPIEHDQTTVESTTTLSVVDLLSDTVEVSSATDGTMLMWTVFCVICVTILILSKWIFSLVSSSSTGPIHIPERLAKVEQEVVTKRNSLAGMKENLGLDRNANLKEQAKRLKALNRRLAKRLERTNKLAPIKSALETLKADLGNNVDDKIYKRKLYIQNMKNLRSILDKNSDLKRKIDQSRYEHLIMIRNFVRLDDLMDLMRDIEFNKVSSSLKESTFATKVETDFLKEQIGAFKDLVQKLTKEYDSLKEDIAQEKAREKFNEEELVRLKDLCDELDINDSVDDWKRRVADKEAETDKYYKDYINNYYKYIHDFSQRVEVS